MPEDALHSPTPFALAGFHVEPSSLRLVRDGQESRLESKSMQVLLYLVEHAGEVVSRSELEARLWEGRIVTEDAVTNAIAKLRRAFKDDARQPRVIETVPKRGYRLIAAVTPIDAATASPRAAQLKGKTARILSAVLLILALSPVLWYLIPEQGQPPSARPSVAVLPFDNLGGAPEQAYFSSGISADLITDLSKVSSLWVLATGAVVPYRDSDMAPQRIAEELGVDYVVLGSLQRQEEHLRVNVQLIHAGSDRAIWGDRYTGTMDGLFALQDRLASEVLQALKVELAPREREYLARHPSTSVIAYDHYLRGMEEHGHRSKEQNTSAKEQFERAIELDPSFARAYAGLALVYSRDAIDGWASDAASSLQRAADLVRKATELDPSYPQVHFVAGQIALFQKHHVQALEAAQRAIRVDPNYADAHALNAWVLNYAGRPAQAETEIDLALGLNPSPPASYREVLGEIRYAQRRYLESAAIFRQVLDINPNYSRARMWSAAMLALAGDREGAAWETVELLVLNPEFSLSKLAYAFPFKDPRALNLLMDGLRRAGLPE